MIVQFHKDDERRYSITIVTDDGQHRRMGAAPGYDPFLPHDLQHFIVERELGLEKAIFGQIAAGGTAGVFTREEGATPGRARSRQRRALRKKSDALRKAGQDESQISERATMVCMYHWMHSSSNPKLRRRADEIEQWVTSTMAMMDTEEKKRYTPAVQDRISKSMASLSSKWQKVGIGQHLEVSW